MNFRTIAAALVFATIVPVSGPALAQSSTSIEAQQNRMARAQERLGELGLYQGEPTGRRNPATRRAIVRFQEDNQIAVTGTLTAQTFELLMASAD